MSFAGSTAGFGAVFVATFDGNGTGSCKLIDMGSRWIASATPSVIPKPTLLANIADKNSGFFVVVVLAESTVRHSIETVTKYAKCVPDAYPNTSGSRVFQITLISAGLENR